MPSAKDTKSPFALSELATKIFRQLETEDIVCCCLVSKRWYEYCHRLVWRVITFRPSPARYSKLHEKIVRDLAQRRLPLCGSRDSSISSSYDNDPRAIPSFQVPSQFTFASRLSWVEDLVIDLSEFPSLKPEASVKHILEICSPTVRALSLLVLGSMSVSLEKFSNLRSLHIQDPCPSLVASIRYCSRLTSLTITYSDNVVASLLPEIVRSLPNLRDLSHRRPCSWSADPWVEDEIGAKILESKLSAASAPSISSLSTSHPSSRASDSQCGWRHIEVSVLGCRTADVLLTHHSSTLESLQAWSTIASSRQLVDILSSSPRLIVFSLPVDCHHPSFDGDEDHIDENVPSLELTPMDAVTFIDRDPASGALRPWQCETAMREFSVPIRYNDGVTSRSYYSTSASRHQHSDTNNSDTQQLLQEQVLERVLRFTHLRGFTVDHKARRSLANAMVIRTAQGSYITTNERLREQAY